MQLGLVGLGKMGGNMRERLRRAGHTVVGYDRNPDVSDASSLDDLVAAAAGAAGRVGDGPGRATRPAQTVDALGELLERRRRRRRRRQLPLHRRQGARRACSASMGIGFVDAGVSGGVWGLENGYALMVGGDAENVAKVQPIFDALKPEGDVGLRARRPGRRRPLREDGAQRHRVRPDAGLRRGLRAARGGRVVEDVPGRHQVLDPGHRDPVLAARPARARPGEATPSSRRSAATSRTPARAGGPSRRPSTTPCRCR